MNKQILLLLSANDLNEIKYCLTHMLVRLEAECTSEDFSECARHYEERAKYYENRALKCLDLSDKLTYLLAGILFTVAQCRVLQLAKTFN